MTGEEADGLARQVISEAGHGDDFGHSLGHGLGLEVHEDPHVGPRADDVLQGWDAVHYPSRVSTFPAGEASGLRMS